jgi:hypothetical protein
MSPEDKQEFSADSARYHQLYAERKQLNQEAEALSKQLLDYTNNSESKISDLKGCLVFWPIFKKGNPEAQLSLVFAFNGNNGDTAVVINGKSHSLRLIGEPMDTLDFVYLPESSTLQGDTLEKAMLVKYFGFKTAKQGIIDQNAQIEFLRERWMGRLK